MTKIKTVYDMLLPDVKTGLQESARKYVSAKRLKYTLMSKTMWSDLTITEAKDLIAFGNIDSWKLDSFSFMYGNKIVK